MISPNPDATASLLEDAAAADLLAKADGMKRQLTQKMIDLAKASLARQGYGGVQQILARPEPAGIQLRVYGRKKWGGTILHPLDCMRWADGQYPERFDGLIAELATQAGLIWEPAGRHYYD